WHDDRDRSRWTRAALPWWKRFLRERSAVLAVEDGSLRDQDDRVIHKAFTDQAKQIARALLATDDARAVLALAPRPTSRRRLATGDPRLGSFGPRRRAADRMTVTK